MDSNLFGLTQKVYNQVIKFTDIISGILPNARFQEINLDWVGPLPQSNGCSYILTIIDSYIRYLTAIPMQDATVSGESRGS